MNGCQNSPNFIVGNILTTPLLEKAISLAGDPIIISDENEVIIWANVAFESKTGRGLNQVAGKRIADIFSFDDCNDYDHAHMLIGETEPSSPWRRELSVSHRDGSCYRAEEIVSLLRDADGRVTHHVSVLHDLTRSDQALRLERLRANQDPLTGLAGRAQIIGALEAGLQHARSGETLLALIFIDLDGFKQINDVHGHLAGDSLLCAVGSRLQGVIRSTDTVGRYGGDEFVVVLPALARRNTAREVAGKLIDQLTQPFALQGGCHCIGASLGLAFFPDHGSSAESLLARADEAMYAAKRRGGRQLAVSTHDVETFRHRRPAVEVPALLTSISAMARPSGQGPTHVE